MDRPTHSSADEVGKRNPPGKNPTAPMKFRTKDFYDQLAGDYHLIFADWRKSVRGQGQILGKVIQSLGYKRPASLLDCTCGIGTQAIGLAHEGYRVQGSDLSRKSIERARKESSSFGLSIKFNICDVCRLGTIHREQFDVVVSCDNSLSHLTTDKDLRRAFTSISRVTKPGGLFLASTRDYDHILKDRPTTTLPVFYGKGNARRVSFQEWTWDRKRPVYSLNHFIVKRKGRSWITVSRSATYRALLRSEMSRFLKAAGFSRIKWRMPQETGYYQPIVTALKATSGRIKGRSQDMGK